MAAINLNIGGDTRQLDRDIQKTVNRVYSINLKTKGDQPLGRITGKVNEFEKSLAASNARVIAFGASAGIIYGVQSAFVSLATSVVEVQKSLQDINVILNVSTTQLNKFGGELFNIAKNTGQSFKNVAEAATEFSRQGLGLEETLKRTNEALILSRLSGLDATKSVEALTAAVNSYASQAVTASEVVNKFANVDAAFAVSSADLAEALARVGSSAAQSGVSLNELIAIVTSAQQTTARGGAVIGNSFKTIFTRLQRGKVVDLLGTLGISDTNANGEVKSTIQLLQELGKVYDTLGSRQQAAVAEQVGGVFQINILKAALADLGKEYSIYNNALNVAASSTDQAVRRNEELNKTFAAQLNALKQNITQFSGSIGESLLAPLFDRTVGNLNELLGGINESDANSYGAVLGKGILDGLGQIIAGPGLALVGGVLIKLFRDFSVYASGSLKDLLGLNSAAKQQGELQKSIAQIISKNPDLYALMQKGATGLNQASQILLQNLKAQTLELATQQKLSAVIAKQLYGSGVRFSEGVPVAPTSGKSGKPGKASGFIPNFARVSDQQKTGEIMGALDGGYIPGKVFEIEGMVANGAEDIYKYPGVSKPEIRPPEGSKAGEEHRKNLKKKFGFVPGEGRAKGFIPNFANTVKVDRLASVNPRIAKSIKGNLEGDDTITSKNIQSLFFENVGNQSGKKYEVEALKYLNSVSGGGFVDSKSLKYGNTSAIDAYRVKGDQIDLAEFKGGRFLNQLILNKILRGVPENYGKGNLLDTVFKEGIENDTDDVKVGGYLVQSSKKNQKEVGSKFSEKNVIKAKAAERISKKKYYEGRASGFIPNFAKIIDLGDTVTAPQLTGKVSSLIHPKVTGGQEKRKVTANYLGQQYQGLVTTAGINQAEIENTVPNLEKNLGRILVDEANQFGQAIGGQNFLKNPDELPNYGAVKGAVGTAFEGGVTTLLQRNLQKSSQTAGIDFTQQRMTAKMKRLFHGAPGTYEAKYSPDLANEVLGKMLRAANVGGVKQAKSGPDYKATQALRAQALKNLEGLGLKRGKQLNAAIEKEMAKIKREGMAAGYIPNFAAEEASKKREIARAGSAVSLYSDRLGSLVTVNEPQIAKYGPDADKIIKKDHIDRGQVGTKSNLMKTGSGKEKYKARGFIPNFAVGESSEPADLGASIAALTTQLGGLAFMLSFSKDGIKNSLQEMVDSQKTASGMTVGDAKLQQATIQEELTAAQAKQAVIKEEMATAKQGSKEAKALAKEHANATKEVRKLSQAQSSLSSQIQGTKNKGDVTTATRGQKMGAAIGGNAMAIGMIAPMLAETAVNAIGTESKGSRVGSAAVSGVGNVASMAGMGFMVGGPVGAAVGGAVGALTLFSNVVKEASTNLPELARAAKKASEDYTKATDANKAILETYNTLSGLDGPNQKGQAVTVESDLINQIQNQFGKDGDTKVAGQAIAAVKSRDFEALSKALEENTKSLTAKNIEGARKESVGKFKEESASMTLAGADLSGGAAASFFKPMGVNKESEKKYQELFKTNILSVSDLGTGKIQGQKLQDLDTEVKGIESASPEALSKIFDKIGVDFEATGIEGKEKIAAAYEALKADIMKRAEIERAASVDSAENNAKIKVLNRTIQAALSSYRVISKNVASSAKLEYELSMQRRALSVEFKKTVLEGQSEVSKVIGGSPSRQREISNEARVTEIRETRNKTNGDAQQLFQAEIADFIRARADSQAAAVESKQGLQGKSTLERTEDQAKQALLLNPAKIDEQITAAMGSVMSGYKGTAGEGSFNLKSLEAKLRAGLDTNDKDAEQKLQAILDQARGLKETAKKAAETEKAQLAILAQQNMNQLAQEFAAATVASFGGFQAEYLDKDSGDKSFATGVGDMMMERQGYVDAIQRRGGGAMSSEETQELGRRSGNVLSQIEKMTGRSLGGGLELQSQEIQGRAAQLKEQRAQIQSEAGSDPAVAEALLRSAELMAQQTGFGPQFAEILANTKEGSQERGTEIDDLMNSVFEVTANTQSNELRKTAENEDRFFNAAKDALPEDQRKALDEAGAQGMELFKSQAFANAEAAKANALQATANGFLEKIQNDIKQALAMRNQPPAPPAPAAGAPSASNNTTVSPTVNINVNGANGAQVNAEGMSAETAKILEENKDRILAAGGLADKVANLENAVYSQDPSKRPPPKSDYYRNVKYA